MYLAGNYSLAVLAAVAMTACSSGPAAPDVSSYLTDIAATRANTNRVFAETAECGTPAATEECSPVPAAKRAASGEGFRSTSAYSSFDWAASR